MVAAVLLFALVISLIALILSGSLTYFFSKYLRIKSKMLILLIVLILVAIFIPIINFLAVGY